MKLCLALFAMISFSAAFTQTKPKPEAPAKQPALTEVQKTETRTIQLRIASAQLSMAKADIEFRDAKDSGAAAQNALNKVMLDYCKASDDSKWKLDLETLNCDPVQGEKDGTTVSKDRK